MPKTKANRVKLLDILEDMRKAFPGYADLLGSEFDDETMLVRKAGPAETVDIQPKQHVIVGRISTIAVDTYNEVVLPEGIDTSHYEKNNVVLWGHNYLDYLPHGENIWLTPYPRKSPHEVRAATRYYVDQERGRDVFAHRELQRPLGYSIGYIPLKDVLPQDDDWKEMLEEWQDRYAEYKGGNITKRSMPKPDRITARWLLLEYSDVVVPANSDAVQIYVEKGFIKPEQVPDYTIIADDTDGMTKKTVIPYKDLGKAAEDTAWDGPKEVAAADTSDLKLMCTWYDSDNADVKSAYKLPHHKAAGGHVAVWHGVAAAMAALLGARGGVNIPDSDKKSVYNHLAKHYPLWDKEPPEFKEYRPETLDIIELMITYPDKEFPVKWVLMDGLEPAFRTWDDTLSAFCERKDDFDLEKIVADADSEDDIDIDSQTIVDLVTESIKDIFKPSGESHNESETQETDEINLDELPTPEEMRQLKMGKVL